jgi:hypothetical protein
VARSDLGLDLGLGSARHHFRPSSLSLFFVASKLNLRVEKKYLGFYLTILIV